MTPVPVYDADGITVYHGDCLDVMPHLRSTVDFVFADLPYQTTRNTWDREIDPKALWHNYHALCAPTSPVVLFGAGAFAASTLLSNPDEFRYDLIWDKEAVTGFLNANRQPLRAHENLLVFYGQLGTYNPQKIYTGRKTHSRGTRVDRTVNHYGHFVNTPVPDDQDGYQHPRSILPFKRPKLPKGKGHPTQKPIALCEWAVRSWSNPGDMVLDNVAGSGSTLVAARNTGRRAIGIEKNTDFIEMMVARLSSGSEGDNW
jgi:site-specific DNA-methyltransferase (adenine-specific)